MKLLYVANIRLPTEKAHGIAIMKMCEALTRAGIDVQLVVARRFTSFAGTPHEAYGIRDLFKIVRLPVIDLFGVGLRGRLPFLVECLTFYTSLFFWLLLQPRERIIYTRNRTALLCALFGFRVIFECHARTSKRFLFFLARRAVRIVVISHSLKDEFLQAGFKEEHLLVAPSGVDVERFGGISKAQARGELGLPHGQFLAVYTGGFTSLGEDKGVLDVFDALVRARAVHFLAAGAKPEELVRYSEQARAMGLSERVTLLGHVPHGSIPLYLCAADVLLMPYHSQRYRHHLSPMKMFEYMASGRPIVASDVPTVREVLDEHSAMLVPPGNPEAMAEAFMRLAQDPQLGERLAAEARSRVYRYSWEERARRVVDFIS